MNQPQTFLGKRGETEIKDVSYKQLYTLVRKKLSYSTFSGDPDAFCQDMCCQIEQLMGIYPNVPALKENTDHGTSQS